MGNATENQNYYFYGKTTQGEYDMSRNQDDILDRLNRSIDKCRRATDNFAEAISDSSDQDSLPELPDLTDYLRHSESRRLGGFPSLRKKLISENNLTNSSDNLENNDPNPLKPDVRNSPHK